MVPSLWMESWKKSRKPWDTLCRHPQLLTISRLSQVKVQEALLFYQRGSVSFGRAAELAGLLEPEMMQQARAAGIEPRWTEAMVEEELA